ncbi:MAG: DUF1501 domain-containing protein, partial [Planctomycetaceae bacterium]
MSAAHSSPKQRRGAPLFPCGTTRREFVWEMGGGLAGTALATLLAEQRFFAAQAHAAGSAAVAGEGAVRGPLASRSRQFASPIRSVIFLMMNGAPSQVDTFDHKPVLEKFAGQALPADKK